MHRGGWRRNSCNVHFGSKADICSAKWHVRFTPKSDRKCGHHKPFALKIFVAEGLWYRMPDFPWCAALIFFRGIYARPNLEERYSRATTVSEGDGHGGEIKRGR